ncbi:MAG: hypothetical protein ACREA0_28630, partial [bacterium]
MPPAGDRMPATGVREGTGDGKEQEEQEEEQGTEVISHLADKRSNQEAFGRRGASRGHSAYPQIR